MKKINSIDYGHKFLGVATVFLIALPVCSYFFFTLFRVDLLKKIAFVSLGMGILVSVFFIILLLVEFHQDRVIDHQYAILRKTKMAIGSGMYECQSCGNQQVRAADNECKVCGMYFYKKEGQEDENEDGE